MRLSDYDKKRLIRLWAEYGELLTTVAKQMVEETYASQSLKTTEFETVRQGIAIPVKVQTIHEFLKVIQQDYAQESS